MNIFFIRCYFYGSSTDQKLSFHIQIQDLQSVIYKENSLIVKFLPVFHKMHFINTWRA